MTAVKVGQPQPVNVGELERSQGRGEQRRGEDRWDQSLNLVRSGVPSWRISPLHMFGLMGLTGAHGENPMRHRENYETPHGPGKELVIKL